MKDKNLTSAELVEKIKKIDEALYALGSVIGSQDSIGDFDHLTDQGKVVFGVLCKFKDVSEYRQNLVTKAGIALHKEAGTSLFKDGVKNSNEASV